MLKNYLSLIKFSHTVFALPFALICFFLEIHNNQATFNLQLFICVLLCMVFARSAAMAFNRYIDRGFDAKNARTTVREIPAGVISPKAALLFTILCSAAFITTTYFINQLCFYLSPVALLVILGYSYTKRFTPLCHLVLGVGLSLAPVGAYIALTQEFAVLPIIFGCIVLFWVSGFDIIYAMQDEDFDRKNKLNSIPVLLGGKNALRLAKVFHIICALLVCIAFALGNFSWLYQLGALVFIFLLIYQHSLVKPTDLSKVNLAFGTTNGIASVVFCIFVSCDIFFL
jgi:4-hydroxybenzoate polyprenyltransferase